MSAFSRGLRPRLLLLPKGFHQHQFFFSSSITRVVNQSRSSYPLKQILPKNKPSYTPAKSATPATPVKYQTFASRIAQRGRPTTLYQAPSHALFMVSSYSAALFCFSYAGINFWSSYLHPPDGITWWVPISFGCISFAMAAFGGWLLLGPARLIKTITAIPNSVMGNSSIVPTELKLEIELRKMFPLPFFPARKLYAKPDEIELPSRLSPVDRRLSVEQMKSVRLQEEMEKKKQLEYEQSHIMSSPIRLLSRALSRLFFDLFQALGRTWTREGFMKLRLKGQTYKLDGGGWVLDRGKALDRLVTIKAR